MRHARITKIITVLLALLLTLPAAAPVYAKAEAIRWQPPHSNAFGPYNDGSAPPQTMWHPSMVSGIPISKREEGLEMSGEIANISPEYGQASQFLNSMIDGAVSNRIRMAKDSRARSLSFRYETHFDVNVVSIIILSTVTSATPKTEVDSINFNPETGIPVSMTEAVGFDLGVLAEKILSERIRSNPETYNAALDTKGIMRRPFYLENGQVVILFDEFQLFPVANGINELRFDLYRIRRVSISPAEYHVNLGYNLRMVPLNRICSGLGYEVEWVEQEQKVYIRDNGMLISDLSPGVNNYVEYGKRMRSLETAPEFSYGTIYVPISFFDQILSWITYTVDERNHITFYSYNE